MRRINWIGIVVAMLLVLVVAACDGDDEPEQLTEERPAPTRTLPPPTQPPPPTEALPDTLDFALDPNFGLVELESGFAPDPLAVDVVSGGSIDVDSLRLDMGCAGYVTAAPDYRLVWSGDATYIRIFFVPQEDGADTTLIINDAEGNWRCNDDYSGLNPLVEVTSPAQGQFDIWVGSYSAGEQIAGTLYVTELTFGPQDYGSGALISQWASFATASSEYSSPDWGAIQADGAHDTFECGDIETAWASSSSSGVEWLELMYTTPVVPTNINIYETHSPGFVNEVEVLDQNGVYHTVWTGTPGAVDDCPRILAIPVGSIDFRVAVVRVHLDQRDGGSWNEIDAVELIGQP